MASMTDTMATTDTTATGTTPISSVVDQTNQITSQDSPLMQQAAATANRSAARSGLQNSSLAIGAAQGAVTAQAADLAKAEVSANQAQQGIENQASQYNRSQTEAERAAQVTEGQAQQQITNQASQFSQSLAQQKAESAQQNTQFQATLKQQQAELAAQSKQFAQSIQANVKGSYTDAANNILNNSSVNINNIASNASLKQADKDKLIAQEITNRNNDLAYLQQMYSSVNSWSASL